MVAVDELRRIAEQPRAVTAITSSIVPKVSEILQRTVTLFLSEKIGQLRGTLDQLKAETTKVIGLMLADDLPRSPELATVRGCLNWATKALGTNLTSLEISSELGEFRNAFDAWKSPSEIQPTDDPVEAARRRIAQATTNIIRVQAAGIKLFEKLSVVVSDAEKYNNYSFKSKAAIGCIAYAVAFSLVNDRAYEELIAAAEVFLPADVLAEARSILPRLKMASGFIGKLGEALDKLKAVMERYWGARLYAEELVGSQPADVGVALAEFTNALKPAFANVTDVLRVVAGVRNRVLARLDGVLWGAANEALKLASGLAVPLQTIMTMLTKVSDGLTESAKELPSIDWWKQDPAISQLLGKPITDLDEYLKKLRSELTVLKNEASAANVALAAFASDAKYDNAVTASAALGKVPKSASSVQQRIDGIASAVQEIGQALLKGNLALLVDVDAPRRAIEKLVRDLVPHKATMTYDLDGEVKPLANIFIPDPSGGKRLTITSRTEIDQGKTRSFCHSFARGLHRRRQNQLPHSNLSGRSRQALPYQRRHEVDRARQGGRVSQAVAELSHPG